MSLFFIRILISNALTAIYLALSLEHDIFSVNSKYYLTYMEAREKAKSRLKPRIKQVNNVALYKKYEKLLFIIRKVDVR